MGGRMPSIGETLREARMRQQLDIADVEQRTKIRAKYLRALENEEWAILPGPTFVKTFLRTYADLVGVDAHLLVEEYRATYDPDGEVETQSRAGKPVAARRPSRRRSPPRGPPGRGAVAMGLVVLLVAFLLVLGLVGGGKDTPGSQQAATDQTDTQARRRPKPRPRPAAPATGVTVRVAPAAPTYACMDTGEGTGVVFEGTLDAPRTFKNAKRLRVNLGKRAVDLRLNGKPVQIPPSPDPVGFDLTPKGATELPVGTRPCA
jgi:cytoskeleton protein RodZ